MEDETNPYEPNASHGVFNEPPNKLSGFFRGVRNGFFWSLPIFVTLTIFIATYGRKPPPIHAAMLEAFRGLDCSRGPSNTPWLGFWSVERLLLSWKQAWGCERNKLM